MLLFKKEEGKNDWIMSIMKLRDDTNYIVSGLERSGTSMMMQILAAGRIPVEYNETRKPDDHNPKGYYELEGGKILNKLLQGTFPLQAYKGRFIKITAYGILYLPSGVYKIIYMERNIDEVLDSMEKMMRIIDPKREETKLSFNKLNEKIKKELKMKDYFDVLFMNYNDVLKNPRINVQKVCDFIGPFHFEKEKMIAVVDNQLYRHRQ